jgi:hypothetical protein
MAMFYIQRYDRFVNPGSKPGKWTWQNAQFGHDLGPETKPTTLLRVKHLFVRKIAKVEAKFYKNPASSIDQHEQRCGIHARLPRAMLNRKTHYFDYQFRALDRADSIKAAVRMSVFLANRTADKLNSPNRIPLFKYQYLLPRKRRASSQVR